jgi:signal peptidase I
VRKDAGDLVTAANTKDRRLGTVDAQAARDGGEPKALPPMGLSLAIAAATALVTAGLVVWLWTSRQAGTAWLVLLGGLFALWAENRALPGLRERAALRHARHEAKRLAKSVGHALRKQAGWLSDDAKNELKQALETVARALPSQDLASVELAGRGLDEVADKHLTRKGAAREYVEQIGGAILVALFVRAFVYEAFKIPSQSMVPTLLVGDHLFVNKFVYGLRVPFTLRKVFTKYPERGDIVVFNKPGDEHGDDVIKRVIGLPGDTIEVRDRQITVNGEPLRTERDGIVRRNNDGDLVDDAERGPFSTFVQFREQVGSVSHVAMARLDSEYRLDSATEGSWTVEEGHVFVMGDNRDNSMDSRFGPSRGGFGQIPVAYVKGRADVIWLSIRQSYELRFDRMFTRIR